MRWLFYPPLFILSLLYRAGLSIREKIYGKGWVDLKGVSIPVISVGNITLGGTGKTPVVEKLSAMLKEAGFRPGIATRGYKRKKKGTFSVDPKRDRALDVGDEALMLARRTQVPVLVGSDRAEAIGMGMKRFSIDLALLDDGFQLKNIEKDIEVVVVNGSGKDAGHDLFPLGPYREPVERLREADIILVNKGELDPEMEALAKDKPRYRIRYRPTHLYSVKYDGMLHYGVLRENGLPPSRGSGITVPFSASLRSWRQM